MFKLRGTYWYATSVLFILGLFNVANGLFHFLWHDSGAGSVMGADLSGPAGSSLVFMLGVVGALQVIVGLVYLYVVFRDKALILGAFFLESTWNLMALYLHYGPKMPDPIAPHRFINIGFLALSLLTISTLILAERKPQLLGSSVTGSE